MSTTPPQRRGPAGMLLDLSPLRDSPAYRRLWIGGVASGIGVQLTAVAVGIHVYDISGSTFAVALVGGFALLPMLVVGLLGGVIVDAVDRRATLILCSIIAFGATVGLALLAFAGVTELAGYYLLTTLGSTAGTLVGTARFAILPRLVPRHQLPAASALSGISAGLQVAFGPMLAGVLVALVGYGPTYAIDALLYAIGFLGIITLPRIPPSPDAPRLGLRAVLDGVRFVVSARSLRLAIGMHAVAVVLSRPHVLFPAIAATLLGGGSVTVGALASAAAIGVLLSGLLSGPVTRYRWHGKGIGLASVATGATTVLLGLVLLMSDATLSGGVSVDEPRLILIALAMVVLATWGVADNAANIFRTTMLHAATPDHLRGRLQGVFTMILTAGPRLGDFLIGSLAALTTLWFPSLAAGLVLLLIVGALLALNPLFRHYDAEDPRP
jgi:MFS family permease